MTTANSFLHTTHRTVTWFNGSEGRNELELRPPFQRKPVWTHAQKAYLIDTILSSLPVPEIYMQDTVDASGAERHVVVDGQQRIRACIEFVRGDFELLAEGSGQYAGSRFDNLPGPEKELVFGYKFVVRILPAMPEVQLRDIFQRLNRNVVALNAQELRHATYWGPFIKAIERLADDDKFWASSGLFTANDHRRMIDCEYISELAIAFLHGAQNKKDKLDHYYQLYEEEFEQQLELEQAFRDVTSEVAHLLPDLARTRWRRKSDFYTLFQVIADRIDVLPFARDERARVRQRLGWFGKHVTQALKLEDADTGTVDPDVLTYARAVSRAASDKLNRLAREGALSQALFGTAGLAPSATESAPEMDGLALESENDVDDVDHGEELDGGN